MDEETEKRVEKMKEYARIPMKLILVLTKFLKKDKYETD